MEGACIPVKAPVREPGWANQLWWGLRISDKLGELQGVLGGLVRGTGLYSVQLDHLQVPRPLLGNFKPDGYNLTQEIPRQTQKQDPVPYPEEYLIHTFHELKIDLRGLFIHQ